MVGFRKRFLLRLLLLTRPDHSDLGFLSAEWSSFTKRTGKGTHPIHVLRGLPQKVGIGSLNLSRLKGLPPPGPVFWITAQRVARTTFSSTAHSHPALCGEHCCALVGQGSGSSGQAGTAGCFLPPPDDSESGTSACRLQSFSACGETLCLGYLRQGWGCLT